MYKTSSSAVCILNLAYLVV